MVAGSVVAPDIPLVPFAAGGNAAGDAAAVVYK